MINITNKLITCWWVLPLIVCLGAAPAAAELLPSTVSSPTQRSLSPQTVVNQLSQSRVVYLGETHDSAADHQSQLELLKALHVKNPNLAIGMEMFQRPFQSALDRYIAGSITAAELQRATEYDDRWGFPWEFYAPILEFAKANRIPVIALNTPNEVTRKVARQGLESLTSADKRFIPPLSEIRLEPQRYRDRIRKVFDGFHQGKGNSQRFERFFQAQVLWDETMADSIAQFLKRRDRQLIVLVGQGHVVFGDGIPSRVTRRLPKIQQSTVLLNPPEEFLRETTSADYFWKTSR